MRLYCFVFGFLICLSFTLSSCAGEGVSSSPSAQVDSIVGPDMSPEYIEDLGIDIEAGIPAGLPIGEQAPNFEGTDQYGRTFELYDFVRQGPVVLMFYRGAWCGYCTKHLSNLQDSLDLILEQDAAILAITPEGPEHIQTTIEKSGTKFPIIVDTDAAVSGAFDTKFSVNKSYINKANNFVSGGDLSSYNKQENASLPVPATFILDERGKVVWRHFDIDYSKRPSVAELLNQLKSI